jgi:hypothetical protein
MAILEEIALSAGKPAEAGSSDNKLATPEQPVCGQQNPYFGRSGGFVASGVRAVRARSLRGRFRLRAK